MSDENDIVLGVSRLAALAGRHPFVGQRKAAEKERTINRKRIAEKLSAEEYVGRARGTPEPSRIAGGAQARSLRARGGAGEETALSRLAARGLAPANPGRFVSGRPLCGGAVAIGRIDCEIRGGVCEIKTRDHDLSAPPYDLDQLAAYCVLGGYSYGYLAELYPDGDLVVTRYGHDELYHRWLAVCAGLRQPVVAILDALRLPALRAPEPGDPGWDAHARGQVYLDCGEELEYRPICREAGRRPHYDRSAGALCFAGMFRFACGCGSALLVSSLPSHLKSKKHRAWAKTAPPPLREELEI